MKIALSLTLVFLLFAVVIPRAFNICGELPEDKQTKVHSAIRFAMTAGFTVGMLVDLLISLHFRNKP